MVWKIEKVIYLRLIASQVKRIWKNNQPLDYKFSEHVPFPFFSNILVPHSLRMKLLFSWSMKFKHLKKHLYPFQLGPSTIKE